MLRIDYRNLFSLLNLIIRKHVLNIEYHEDRKLDKSLILRLAMGIYIENKKNIIIKGLHGNGKTWLNCTYLKLQNHNIKLFQLFSVLNKIL